MKPLISFPPLKLAARTEPPPVDGGRVVELFRNRAELKKAYAGVQQELHRLKDRLKQQEGATARVQELLESLEQRLASPDTAYPALVLYHLRGLWQCGQAIIERLVTELVKQQEEKERRLHLAEANRRQFARRQEAERRLREAEAAAVETRQRVADLAERRRRLTRFWHYFSRRDAERALHAAKAAAGAADAVLTEARAAHAAVTGEAVPEFPGLSLEARRAINLAAIACAELLCARLAHTPLVVRAREAVSRRDAIAQYGEREECEQVMADIARARVLLEQRGQLTRELKSRTDRLRSSAQYRNPADTIPIAESLGSAEGGALPGEALGAGAAQLPNVLAEDTWDLFRVLLR